MNDLIWIGNTLYPRWMAFVVIIVVIVAVSFVIGLVVVAIQGVGKLAWRGARALKSKYHMEGRE